MDYKRRFRPLEGFDGRQWRRLASHDEIRFCLRSIHNYAPWVRAIWVVVDRQRPPRIDLDLAEHHKIRFVDHREIFRGYERLLPTFNSLAIETMLWRIDGLADRFLYFNDDCFLVNPVQATDFLTNIQAGFEPWTGGPGTALTRFDVRYDGSG